MKNESTRKVINVDKPNYVPLFEFKELDNAVIRLSLFKASVEFDITGQTVKLGAKTSKGLKEQSEGFTINKNNLDIDLKNSILVPGTVEIDLELKDASGTMTTASFFITVKSKVLNDKAVEGTNEFDTFTKTAAKIEEDYKGLRRIIIDENQAANLQDQVNQTNAQLETIANKGTTVEVLERVTKEEIDRQVADGTIANLTIGKKGVDYNNTTFLEKKMFNLFDKNSVENVEGIVNRTNGGIISNTSFIATHYIEITSEIMVTNSSFDMAFYNEKKTFISGQGSPQNGIIIPSGAKYMRLTFEKTKIDSAMVCEDVLPSSYIPFGEYEVNILDNEFKKSIANEIKESLLTGEVIPSKSIQAYNTTFFEKRYLNCLDLIKCTDGLLNGANGTINTSNTFFKVSDFIEIEEGEVFYTNSPYEGSFYDEGKKFISKIASVTASELPRKIIGIANAKYFRLNVEKTKENSIMISYKYFPSRYVPFGVDIIDFTDENNIIGMKSQMLKRSKWSGKKWIVIGDSITEVNERTTKNYHKFIAEDIGCTVYNHGKSGTGWFTDWTNTGTGVTNLAFYKRLDILEADADLITIFGGTNDWGQTGKPLVLGTYGDTDPNASLYGAIDYTLKELIKKYYDKKIAVFTPLPRNNNWSNNSSGISMEQVSNAIIEMCNKYSIPVLDLYRVSNAYPHLDEFKLKYMPDGLHPNADFHSVLADKILNFINTI